MSILYQRTLELTSAALDESKAVTLMSADVERICTGLRQVHELWASILEIGLALWLLHIQLDTAAFAPLVVILGTSRWCASLISY